MKRNPVLLMGLFDTSIMTARCFQNTGIQVYGMDHDTSLSGFFSNAIISVGTPNPRQGEEKWLTHIMNWFQTFDNKFVLIPTSDEYVYLCSKYWKELSQYCLSVFPDLRVLNTIIEREKQFNAVISCGVKVPPFLTGKLDLSDLSFAGINFPFAIKPVNAIEWKQRFKNKGFVINTHEDWIKAQFELSKNSSLSILFQSIIEGDNTNNFEVNALYLPNNQLFMHTIRKIRQYPDRFGTATCIESFSNPEVERIAEQIIRNLNLFGFSNIEFKYNDEDGKYYYIETNTRVWLQVNFSMKIGINFPLLYYKSLTSNAQIEKQEITTQGKWVDTLPDLLFYIKYRKKYSMSFYGFVKSRMPVKANGLFSFKDPMPFLKDLNLSKRIKSILS